MYDARDSQNESEQIQLNGEKLAQSFTVKTIKQKKTVARCRAHEYFQFIFFSFTLSPQSVFVDFSSFRSGQIFTVHLSAPLN